MAKGDRVTQARVDRALDIIRLGGTVSDAAVAIECHVGTLYRILPNEYAEEYEAAQRTGALMLADKGRVLAWNLAMKGHPKAFEKVAEAYVPEFRKTERLEVTGDGGGPVRVESKGVSLHALIRFAEQHGIRADLEHGQPGGSLPAASLVLPEPADGEHPAGDVPPPRQP